MTGVRARVVQHMMLATAVVVLWAVTASAEDIRVMSAGAVEPGLVAAADAFERSSGHRIVVGFGTGPQLTARLAAGTAADVLIAPTGVMDAAGARQAIDPTTRQAVGRVGVGVVVRRDAVSPDISSPASLRDAIVASSAVVFNRASTGQYIERLLIQFGIADAVVPKAVRVDTGEAVIARIASGSGVEIGFGATTEIRMLESKGARFVGALPSTVQNFTAYDAAVMSMTTRRSAAAAFVAFLNGTTARPLLRDNGSNPGRAQGRKRPAYVLVIFRPVQLTVSEVERSLAGSHPVEEQRHRVE